MEEVKPEELVVLSWAGGWGQALTDAVSRPFAKFSGIPVRHEVNVGLKLPSTLLGALESSRRPPVDVVWSNAVAALRVAEAGGCDLLDAETVPNLAELHARALPMKTDSGWPIASPYITYYVLAYRSGAFPRAQPPETWEVLLEPRFKDKVALYPGGNGFYPIAQVLGGGTVANIPQDMEACWKFLLKLKPQVGRLDYSIGMGERIRRGELDLCFRALTNALAFRKEGLDVSWTAPVEGITDTMDALWVPKNLPESSAYWAKRYIDFALSPEIQQRWCGLMGVMPLNRKVPPPALFLENSALPQSPDDIRGILHVPDTVKARYEREWEARFAGIFS